MTITNYNNLQIFYNNNHISEVNIITQYHDEVEDGINNLWELDRPKEVNLYFINSFIEYIKYSFINNSLLGKLLMVLLPCIYLDFIRIWKEAAGLFVNIDSKYYIFLRKYNENRSSKLGKYIFCKRQINSEEYLKSIYTHELTHVFSDKLDLPHWLNEGLALYTSEKIINDKIITNKSLELLNEKRTIISISDLTLDNEIKMAYSYIKGYWTIRYLNELYPGFITKLLKKDKGKDVVKKIAKKLGLDTKKNNFDKELNFILYHYFINKNV